MDNHHRPHTVFSSTSRPKKYVLTFAVYYCNFVLGLCGTFLNPLVLHFSRKYHTTVDKISMVFSIVLTGYLISALIGGFILKYINRQLCVIFLLIMLAFPFFGIPFATTILQFFVLCGLIGLSQGCYDAAQIAWIIDIWRDESSPFILAQHFAFSVGTLAAPVLLAPFLSENGNGTHGAKGTIEVTQAPVEFGVESNTFIPFIITGGLVVVALIVQIVAYLVFRGETTDSNSSTPSSSNSNSNNNLASSSAARDDEENVIIPAPSTPTTPPHPSSSSPNNTFQEGVSLKRQLCLIGLSCCVIGFYQGLELCTSQFLPTFSHFSEVHLSEVDGARVLFGLQLGYSIGRFLGIIVVMKIPPHFILAGNFLVLLGANVILLVLAGSSLTWLWVGSVMIGVGMSTVYPALYAFVEKYIHVTDAVAGTVSVAGGLVSAIYPLIVGNSIQTHPAVLTYVNFVSIGVCSVAFAVLFWTTEWKRCRRYKKLT